MQQNNYKTKDLFEVLKQGLVGRSILSMFDFEVGENKQQLKTKDYRKVLAIIAYIFPLWVIGLIMYPSDKTVCFHARQAINLMVFFLSVNLAINMLNFIFILISPLFVMLTALIYTTANIIILVLIIIGCINAAKGKLEPLPIIGRQVN